MSKLPPGWGANQMANFSTKLPLATQVFPVGDMLSADMRNTLKKIKAAGYDGVEFFGGLKYAAQDVKYALDDAGLQIAGWHTPWHYLSKDHIHSTITYNKVLGNQFLVVPWMGEESMKTRDDCLKLAEEFTIVVDELALYGMATGYHNHAQEFRPTDDTGEMPWDIIAQNTPSNFIMQNDIGNGMAGGGDMMEMLRKYPGRGVTVHVKPFANDDKGTFFDDANCVIDWDEYFAICRTQAGVRWYIIEYMDNKKFPNDPMAGLEASAKWFRAREGR